MPPLWPPLQTIVTNYAFPMTLNPSKVPSKPLTFNDAGGVEGLGASGIDATGAIMVGNIAHDDTFMGVVVDHTPGTCDIRYIPVADI